MEQRVCGKTDLDETFEGLRKTLKASHCNVEPFEILRASCRMPLRMTILLFAAAVGMVTVHGKQGRCSRPPRRHCNWRLAFRVGAWQTRRVIIGLFPELATSGGIQRAGRHLAAVMKEFASGRDMECRLLSLNDTPELHRMSVGTRENSSLPAASGRRRGSRRRRSARRGGTRNWCVAGHPYLAPVVQAMRVSAPRMKSIVCTHGIEVWEPLPTLRRRALRGASLILAPTRIRRAT